MKKMYFLALFALTLLVASAHTVAAQGTTETWTVNGVKRQAIVVAPQSGGDKHPLVFAWHGHGGNMNGAARSMHLETLWPEAIVIYPQGLPTPTILDPQGNRPGWQYEAGQQGDRDLKFFDAMVATMRQKYGVDETRIYSTGFSNGGTFSYLLWAERSTVLAAIGECAGRLFETPKEPRAVLAIAGRADTTDPFAEQQRSIETARQVDQATGAGQPCGPVCTLYHSSTHTPVETRIHPGAHVYPQWAPQAIVEFLKAHPHP